uniref:Caspase-7 n=1 Tax=Magallana hongkongensis TaxID=2653900 RepID=A0A8K1JX23_MAGHO|nr:caspase-7 [Crassostrea hongkongensis]
MMANPVNISQERWISETYLTKRDGCLCRPVIIDIRKTYFGIHLKERDSASRDVELLKKTFQHLPGFLEPHIVSDTDSDKENHPLYSVENLESEMVRIARSPEFTCDAQIFLLVVLAFGEYGYFYLPNDPINSYQQRKPIPAKFSTALLMSHFNGNNCRNLVLKPKIFLVQTCNAQLAQKDRSLFMDGVSLPLPARVPIEADLLLYHSEISGGYTSKMKKETRESLGSVIDQGDRNGGGDERETPACQFVYTLYNEVEALAGQQNEFELTDLILRVNRSLMEFIDKEHYRSDEDNKPWTIEPMIPICVDQLTKRLVLGTNSG